MIAFFTTLLRLFLQAFRPKRNILTENALRKKENEILARKLGELDNFLLTGKNQVQRRWMNMSRSTIFSDHISGFNNRFRSQMNRRRQGVLSARVLFCVGCITTTTDRRRNGWNKSPVRGSAGNP